MAEVSRACQLYLRRRSALRNQLREHECAVFFADGGSTSFLPIGQVTNFVRDSA